MYGNLVFLQKLLTDGFVVKSREYKNQKIWSIESKKTHWER